MKKKCIVSIIFILMFMCIFSTKTYAVIEANFVNLSGENKYIWKNDKVYIETREIVGYDKKHYNMLFLSVEFWENFYMFSYYDKENQTFYFDGANGIEYVKGNDNNYYDVNTSFSLVQNADVSTLVIDDRLYIPISLYRNKDLTYLELGFDEKNNTLYYYGPSFSTNKCEEFNIDGVEIIEKINNWNYFKVPEDSVYEYGYSYKSLEHLKFEKDGASQYYLAKVKNKLTIIKVLFKYDAIRKTYIYDKYEQVLDKELSDIEFVSNIENNYFILKKNDKYGLYDSDLNEVLEAIYEEIVFVDNKWSFKNKIDKLDDFNNKISGDYFIIKKDNKYGIYSIEDEKIILNEGFYSIIDDFFEVKKFEYNEHLNEIKEDGTENILACFDDEGKIGIIFNNNLVTDTIYTNVELLKIRYSKMVSDDAIMVQEIVSWKLYIGDEFYILTNFTSENDNFEKINDKIFISKNSYKDINIKFSENNYIFSGIDTENNEIELYKVEKEKGYTCNHYNIGYRDTKVYIIRVLIVITIFVLICITLVVIKYIRNKLKNKN